MYTTWFLVNRSHFFSHLQTAHLQISHQPQHLCHNFYIYIKAIAAIRTSLILSHCLHSTQNRPYITLRVSSFHIISLCTQFADRALFHRALYASWRGSVSPVCPLPWRPLPPSGRPPATNPRPSSLKGARLPDQILCCSRRWGCWGFLQISVPQETRPKAHLISFNGPSFICILHS